MPLQPRGRAQPWEEQGPFSASQQPHSFQQQLGMLTPTERGLGAGVCADGTDVTLPGQPASHLPDNSTGPCLVFPEYWMNLTDRSFFPDLKSFCQLLGFYCLFCTFCGLLSSETRGQIDWLSLEVNI